MAETTQGNDRDTMQATPAGAGKAPAASERRTIACVDGNSLMHRAFHAIPPTMTAPDGRPTNAIFGFASMLQKLVETFRPDGLVIAFDKGKPKVRMEMLPQYKAQRPPMDPTLHEQFPMVKDLLRTMDVPVVELEGWEGDDILGTLAARGEAAGYEMLIVTGDRDMYQLSTDHVRVVTTKKGLSDVAIMTPESVADLYGGITPALVPDFYGLKGDSSDNIPGVPGIGPKKAAALIGQYGDLDQVIAHADEVKGKMGENLRAHVDDALLSRKVATIRRDAPVELDLADARFPTFDPEEVRRAFAALGFNAIANRMAALGAGSDAAQAARSDAPAFDAGELVEGAGAEAALEAACAQGSWLGVALGSPEASKQMALALDEGPEGPAGPTLWVSTPKRLIRLEGDAVPDALVRLLGRAHVAAGDVKALMHHIYPADSSKPAAMEAADVAPERIFDVGVAAYLLDSSKGSYPVAEVAERYLDHALPEPTDELPAAAIEAVACRELAGVLAEALEHDDAGDAGSGKGLFEGIEMPLLPVLAHMERTGLAVDPKALAAQSAELTADIEAERAKIQAAAGEEFNIDSPSQLSHVLFDVLGLPTKGLKKTRSGFYSTNARVLGDLAQTSDVVAAVLDYREKNKIRSTYLDALPALVAGDGRIHTTLNQTVAATGRLSSSNPNLQNIPTRSELGHRVRKAFGVGEGNVFLACDYSQIELRLLAHLSADEHLVAAFCEGEDFHAATAARVFGVAPEEVTPQLRSRAKAVNFGIVYGQQAYGLSQSLKIPMAEAQSMIDRYFEAYPGVRRFLDETVAFARAHKWVATMWGRKRHIPDIDARNPQLRSFAERTAMNHPMQGSAADIIKLAMVAVERRLAHEGLHAKMVLQIHDELDFEVPEAEAEELAAVVQEEMQGVVELRVPLLAEPSWGRTWAEAK